MRLGKLILDVHDRRPRVLMQQRFVRNVEIENIKNGYKERFISVKANNNTISLDEPTRIYPIFSFLNIFRVVREIHIKLKFSFKKE